MIRSYTKRIIASMAHFHARRNFTVNEPPRNSMRSVVPREYSSCPVIKTLGAFTCSTCPYPTIVRLFDLHPKILRCFLQRLVKAIWLAKSSLRFICKKWRITSLTSPWYLGVSHGLNLLDRSRLWLGSRAVHTARGLPVIIALILSCGWVNAQQQKIDYRAEWIKQLAKNEDLQKKLDASVATIDELEKTVKKAQEVQAVSEKERQSMERTIAVADKAFAVYDRAIGVYEKTIETQTKVNEVQAKRIDKLEDKLDRANKRTVWGVIFGGIAGAILGR